MTRPSGVNTTSTQWSQQANLNVMILRPKKPFLQQTNSGMTFSQQAGTHALTSTGQQVRGFFTHQDTFTGAGGQQTGAGSQQTGAGASQHTGAGSQHGSPQPSSPQALAVEADEIQTATATAAKIRARFIGFS
ncbi:hypothetical protein [Rhodopirellula halodulae]|uniref:hypothetical protein n=1 Tax=Rhodopirellula halodulae TaxID=2894198 RepID=UPI001E4B2C60|nr:hypothetical protein [Rhodopirellula sp. JC737]